MTVIAPTRIMRYASIASPKLICDRYVVQVAGAGGVRACGGGGMKTGGACVLLNGDAASANGVSTGSAESGGAGWVDTTPKLTRPNRRPPMLTGDRPDFINTVTA